MKGYENFEEEAEKVKVISRMWMTVDIVDEMQRKQMCILCNCTLEEILRNKLLLEWQT